MKNYIVTNAIIILEIKIRRNPLVGPSLLIEWKSWLIEEGVG